MSRVLIVTAGDLSVRIFVDGHEMAHAAATDGAQAIRAAITERGAANVMLATGNSQLEFLSELVKHTDLDWSLVTAFHMDEYVDLPPTHPASFQRYMRERVAARLPFKEFHYLTGDTGDAAGEAARYAALFARASARPVLLRDRRERPPCLQRPAGCRLRRPARREDRGARARLTPPASRGGTFPDGRRRSHSRDHRHHPRAPAGAPCAGHRSRGAQGRARPRCAAGSGLDCVPGIGAPPPAAHDPVSRRGVIISARRIAPTR